MMSGVGSIPDPVQSAKAAGLSYVSGANPGITRRRSGRGFTYFDASKHIVRDAETIKRIHSLVIPPAWEKVWISPNSNTHIQAVGRDVKGRKQYRYHPRYRSFRDETKFDKLIAFGSVLPRIRRQVKRDLGEPGVPKPKVLATVVRLLDDTCIRVGNDEYVRMNGSYGLTTLRNRHATIQSGSIRLRFQGKSGQKHEVELFDPKVAKIVKRLQDLPGEELFEYKSGAGDFVPVNSADVNEYLRTISGADITAKDFRTWHASVGALSHLASIGHAHSDTETKRNIVVAVKEVASKLGNRPATCRKYYIHPSVIECYSDGSLIECLSRWSGSGNSARGLKKDEAALLHFVQNGRGRYAKVS